MIVIVDIDNTLSINKNRYKLATRSDGSIDWDILYDHDNVLTDLPNTPMIEIVNSFYLSGYKILIFTSRPSVIKKSTKQWLDDNGVNYHKLYMRPKKYHYIKDFELKEKMYNSFIDDKVYCAFDDSDSIINLWSKLNIPTFKVIFGE